MKQPHTGQPQDSQADRPVRAQCPMDGWEPTGPMCIDCGNDVESVDDEGSCSACSAAEK